MGDLPLKGYLHGEHHKEILAVHRKEFDGLMSMILKELFPGDSEYGMVQRDTNCQPS